MPITLGNYEFEGPYKDTSKIEDRSGVYAILCLRDKKYLLIDVGESATVRSRLVGHDRSDCWKHNCSEMLAYAILYTPNKQQSGRMEIEQELREKYDPVCGKR